MKMKNGTKALYEPNEIIGSEMIAFYRENPSPHPSFTSKFMCQLISFLRKKIAKIKDILVDRGLKVENKKSSFE